MEDVPQRHSVKVSSWHGARSDLKVLMHQISQDPFLSTNQTLSHAGSDYNATQVVSLHCVFGDMKRLKKQRIIIKKKKKQTCVDMF